MLETLLILAIIFICASLCAFVSDFLTSPKQVKYERKTVPFTSRHLKRDEIEHLIHQIAIFDAVHPMGPSSYHDDTQICISEIVSERLGRRFEITPTDWFHIVRAWHVTRGQDLHERCERLQLRLLLNI